MDEELDPQQYLRVLWKRRYVVGIVALGAVLVAGALSFMLPPTYEAKAMVMVTKPPYQIGAPPDPGPGLKIGTVLISELPTETLVVFAKSDAVTRRIESRYSRGGGGNRRITDRLTARALRNTNLLELRVKGSDPERVAAIANEWAALIVLKSETLFSTQAQQSYAFFDSRLRTAKEALEVAEETLRKFNASSSIGVLEARLGAATEQIAEYQSRLSDVSVVLPKTQTELVQAETQIQRQPRILTLSKSITTDPFLHQTASEATNRNFIELSRLKLTNEELNPVYINLDQARANLSIQLAGLKAERARVSQAVAQLTDDVSELRGQLATQRLVQTQLARAMDNAKQVFDLLSQRREEAQVASAVQSGSAKLAAEAVVPDAPVAPRKALNTLLAGVFGLMVGTVLALVLEYFGAPGVLVSARTTSIPSPSPRSEA